MYRANFRFWCNKSNFENPHNHLYVHTYIQNALKRILYLLKKSYFILLTEYLCSINVSHIAASVP
jgi:hypothetical protein